MCHPQDGCPPPTPTVALACEDAKINGFNLRMHLKSPLGPTYFSDVGEILL